MINCNEGKYPKEEVAEAVEEVLELQKEGQLFAPDIYENYIFDFKNRPTVVKSVLFCGGRRVPRKKSPDEF